MWQAEFEKYKDRGFTVVGLALDAEGIAPARLYYEKYGVSFPALVDPNYATGFGAVPKTFFVNELGIVQNTRGWQQTVESTSHSPHVTDQIRSQWSRAADRLEPAAIAALVAQHRRRPDDLQVAVELASRYLDLELFAEAQAVLRKAVCSYVPLEVARSQDSDRSRLLGQAYLQLARACVGDRKAQVSHATLSYYLNPSVGFGKQIARLIAPEKFDGRPDGDFDNDFREGTLRRLKAERAAWLQK